METPPRRRLAPANQKREGQQGDGWAGRAAWRGGGHGDQLIFRGRNLQTFEELLEQPGAM